MYQHFSPQTNLHMRYLLYMKQVEFTDISYLFSLQLYKVLELYFVSFVVQHPSQQFSSHVCLMS